MNRSYEVTPRAADLGGGWNLKLLEDGVEEGGGYFPPVPSSDEAYAEALLEGEDWSAPFD